MADNTVLPAGTADGDTYASDDIAGIKFQRVKLVHGADGTNDGDVSTANGLPVQITSPGTAATSLGKAEDAGHTTGDTGVMLLGVANTAAAGLSGTTLDYTPISTTLAGDVNTMARRGTVRVSVASAGLTTASTAYIAGDQVGAQFTIAGCSRASGGTGRIRSVSLISAADIIGAYDVVITRASISLAADNAAYAISDADALNVVALVQLAGAFDLGANRIAQAFNLDIPYDCSGGTSLYAGLITRVGHTFFAAETDLQLVVFVEPD